MDLAVTLIKSVLRAFYQTREILVIDALILHETLRDDDLSYLMAMNPKDLHKICGKLREDRFLVVHTRPEYREGNPRPSNKTWYYINYRSTIDAIKWRMYTVGKDIQGSTVETDEKKEYFCSHCKAEWTAMEVLDHHDPRGFLCHRCNHLLTFDSDRNPTGHEQSTRLNDQFRFITDMLPKIDSVFIPECDFDRAFAKARPVVRDATHQREATTALDPGANRPMAVKGLSNTGPQTIDINLSTSDGPSAAEKEAERLRKEQIAKQNALPSWMSNSTVTGESFSRTAADPTAAVKREGGDVKTAEASSSDANTSAQIDTMFEALKAEKAREALGEAESEEEEDEDEDEDDSVDFEDVTATGTSSAQNPNTPNLKRDASGETSRDDDSSDERQSKRVKIEPSIKTEGGVAGNSGEASEEDEDGEGGEEEGIDFEDF